jgi:hypothetical protein
MGLLDIRANDAPDDAVFAPGFILAVKSADSSSPSLNLSPGHGDASIDRSIQPTDYLSFLGKFVGVGISFRVALTG